MGLALQIPQLWVHLVSWPKLTEPALQFTYIWWSWQQKHPTKLPTVNQPASPTTSKPALQPTASQPANQLASLTTNKPALKPTANQPALQQTANQPPNQPPNQPASPTTNKPALRPTANQPASPTTNQPASQPTNLPDNQPTSQPWPSILGMRLDAASSGRALVF